MPFAAVALSCVLVVVGCGSSHKTSANAVAAAQLVVLKQRVDALDGRLDAVQPPQQVTQKRINAYADRLDAIISDYTRLAASATSERSKLASYTDPDVHRAWNLLVQRSKLVVTSFRELTSALRKSDFNAFDSTLAGAEAQRKSLDAQFEVVRKRIAARYYGS